MKITKLIPLTALLFAAFLGSCSNDEAADQSAKNAELAARLMPQTADLSKVNLGTAANFAVLSKTGITNVYPSVITGNVGASPITGSAILLSCPEVTGTIFSVDASGPVCKITDAQRLSTAIGDMEAAYTNAAGRTNPGYINLGAGNIGGLTLNSGLYKFTGNVTIPADITISGDVNAIWIFQISGMLNVANGVNIHLKGGAQARNIFWQVAEDVTLGTTSHFEGTILGKTLIALQTGASINGRLLAQTAATLQSSTVTKPN